MNFAKGLCLVTGSSSGIGQAIATRLARDGFHILAHYHRNLLGAEKTRSQITEAGGTCELIQFDVSDPIQIESALEQYEKTKPEELKFTALVNNAGIHQDSLLGIMSDKAFDEVIKANVYGPFYLLRFATRRMIRQRKGVIVNIASLAGQTGNAGQLNYAASKAALIAMTKTLAMEVGSRGVRVNAVAPGLIQTEMLNDIPHMDQMIARIPLGRVGRPEEVAGAVSFLCSDDSSYMSGCTLSVNGGLFPS
jgi:3-oxoacyl-[acyl-carrier protein] reductase